MQKSFFPESASSDYVFMVINEEWGIIGAIFTILILLAIATLCIVIGNKATSRFGMLYSYGFAFLVLFQSFVNVAGISNVIPMTGVTLPFISSGINSLFFMSLGLFVVILIDRESARERKKRKEKNDGLFL